MLWFHDGSIFDNTKALQTQCFQRFPDLTKLPSVAPSWFQMVTSQILLYEIITILQQKKNRKPLILLGFTVFMKKWD